MPPTHGAKGAAAATASALQNCPATTSDKQISKRAGARAQAPTVIGAIPTRIVGETFFKGGNAK
jgi:hypothetical protein